MYLTNTICYFFLFEHLKVIILIAYMVKKKRKSGVTETSLKQLERKRRKWHTGIIPPVVLCHSDNHCKKCLKEISPLVRCSYTVDRANRRCKEQI